MLTIKTPHDASGVTPCSSVSMVNFEQVNGGWVPLSEKNIFDLGSLSSTSDTISLFIQTFFLKKY